MSKVVWFKTRQHHWTLSYDFKIKVPLDHFYAALLTFGGLTVPVAINFYNFKLLKIKFWG